MENQQKRLKQDDSELAASVRGIDLMRVDQCEDIGVNQVHVLSGPAPTVGGTLAESIEQEAKVVDVAAPVKRKRGRPPKARPKTPSHSREQPTTPSHSRALPPPPRNDDKEEDVCFICFDGGDLVLCDRRNCPKAYHPACIKRDEAFFQTTAKWNCGWHICSTCQHIIKSSYNNSHMQYM